MARAKKSGKKTKGAVRVDFTGVEGRVLLPEGDIKAKVDTFTVEKGDAADYMKWKFRTIDKDKKVNDKPLNYNTSLAPQALWNLRNLLEALGVEIPEGPMDIKPEDVADLELILTVEDDEYDGKKRSAVVDFVSVDDAGGDDDDDGEKADVVDDDGEEVEGVTAEAVGEMDEDELNELVEEHDLEVNFKKAKSLKKKRAVVLKALEEADLIVEEGEEEEGDEAEGLTSEAIAEMDADELAEVIEEYGLEINLKKFKTSRKKANAVIDAMEEAGKLVEED